MACGRVISSSYLESCWSGAHCIACFHPAAFRSPSLLKWSAGDVLHPLRTPGVLIFLKYLETAAVSPQIPARWDGRLDR
eukprot:5218511-Amphidinium_carterae.1